MPPGGGPVPGVTSSLLAMNAPGDSVLTGLILLGIPSAPPDLFTQPINLTPMKVFLTGADGFIGSHLAEELVRAGHQVKALCIYNSIGSHGWLDTISPEVKSQMEIVMGDIRDPYHMAQLVKGQDAILHLAALIAIPFSYVAPDMYVQTNIQGTLNLLNAARDAGVSRFIHTSTSEVYGTAQYVPMDEGHVLQGQSPYSATKIGADMMVKSFYSSFELPTITIRPFNTYGPRMDPDDGRVVSSFIRDGIKAKPFQVFGDGKQTRSFCYVDDLIDAMIKMMNSEKEFTGPVNIGNPGEFTMLQLAEMVLSLSNSKSKIIYQPLPSDDPKQRQPNIDLAKDKLGWQPKVELKDGLKETIAYFKKMI